MGTRRIDAAHPLFLRRIARIVGDLFDFVNPTQSRLDVLAMLLLGHHPQLSVRTQARRRNRSNLSVEDCFAMIATISFYKTEGMTANRERPRLTAAPSKDLYPKTKGNAPNLERPIREIGR